MRMANHADVFAAGAELHCYDTLGNQFRGHVTDHVHAENAVGRGIGEELDQPRRVTHRPRPRVGAERHRSAAIVYTLRLQLLFGLADPSDFRRGVDHPGNSVEIDMRMLADNPLCHRDALFLALVREHRPAHHVAHGPDTRNAAAAVVIDDDETAFVELESDGFRIEPDGVGYPADRHDQLVERHGLRFAVGVGVIDAHAAGGRDLVDPDAEVDL